ncbi:hypothetical protein [Anaerosinus sp.]|uniref:hypothetical protein n=1 Tax=Selenobaculum sp. TaxID=3074374 RepID=UPI003AB81DEA
MLINLRDRANKLVVKDILDIDFDMSVESIDEDKYYVNINNIYRLDEEFITQSDAEERMLRIAGARNHLEEELRSY